MRQSPVFCMVEMSDAIPDEAETTTTQTTTATTQHPSSAPQTGDNGVTLALGIPIQSME